MGDHNTVTFSYREQMPDDEYRFPQLTWKRPSVNAYGSMPLGNGDIGINLWVEQDGDLLFYISKTDAYSEHQQLLKIGRVRVHFDHNPFRAGTCFRQILDIQKGTVTIEAGDEGAKLRLCAWVDANHPVIHLEAKSDKPIGVCASLELWRAGVRELTNPKETHSYMMQLLDYEKPVEYPDTIVDSDLDAVTWYHRNECSAVEESLRRQDLAHLSGKVDDLLLGLTSGATMFASGLKKASSIQLLAEGVRAFDLSCIVHTAQTPNAQVWRDQIMAARVTVEQLSTVSAKQAHQRWWADFWQRSWVRISGAPEAEVVNRGYQLQRYMHACSGRGRFPIKFNGSIFTTAHEDEAWGPDYRLWGGSYWIQNTRLSYWPMLMDGDFDLMKPFFELYWNNLPVARERAKQLGSCGAIFPETMTIFGTCNTENYGYARPADLAPGLTENTYIRRYWQGSLEIASIMLDYVAFAGDEAFARDRAVPFAIEVLRFYRGYYTQRDEHGRVRFSPSQSLETWQDAVNPTPDIAGLMWVLDGLLSCKGLLSEADAAFCREYRAMLPPLPTRSWFWTGKKIILPALMYDQNYNWENPELYAVFPYRLYGVGKPELDRGVATYHDRLVKIVGCWTQDAIDAALLGLSDEAKRCVTSIFGQYHAKSRFPAMWDSGGHGFDWVPDQDHGGVGMIAVQRMLMQCDDGKIHLFAAWPKDWNVEFRLHAPGQTVVEGAYRQGERLAVRVWPEDRAADLEVLEPK